RPRTRYCRHLRPTRDSADYVLLLRRATDRASGAAFERSPPHVDQRRLLPAYRGQAGARAWLEPTQNLSDQGITSRSTTRDIYLLDSSQYPVTLWHVKLRTSY